MLYVIEYVRDGKVVTYMLPYAQARALADYLSRTFRITAMVRRAS
jgi:hypothetical protein